MNNATRVNDPSPASYSCSCLDGFTGSHCETDINGCLSSPWQLVQMALINMTASVLMDTPVRIVLAPPVRIFLAPALYEQWDLLRHGQCI